MCAGVKAEVPTKHQGHWNLSSEHGWKTRGSWCFSSAIQSTMLKRKRSQNSWGLLWSISSNSSAQAGPPKAGLPRPCPDGF